MLGAVVPFAVEKLGDFAIQTAGCRLSFKDDVEWLKTEFQYMQSFLKVAERNQSADPRVQQFVCEITDLAREILDTLEEFNSKVGGGSGESSSHGIVDRVKSFAWVGNKEANLYDIGNKIKSFKERVSDLCRRRKSYGIPNISQAGEGSSSNGPDNGSSIRQLRRRTPYADDEQFAGFEDVKKMSSEELLKDEARRSFTSRYGMGSLELLEKHTKKRVKNSESKMKIQCDVCEKAPATVICCADEAALCTKCDIEVHAANKLASKHQRLQLECLSNKLPPCDICQEKAAFIFCVEDRALFCKDCDEPIHSANNLAANHQRYLATGIRIALSSSCNKDNVKTQIEPQPPKPNSQNVAVKSSSLHMSGISSPSWPVEDLLQFSDYESSDKKEQLEFGELAWLSDIGLFGEQVAQETLSAAEVPQLSGSQTSNSMSYKPAKFYMPHKKPRIETPDDDDEYFTVPDLG